MRNLISLIFVIVASLIGQTLADSESCLNLIEKKLTSVNEQIPKQIQDLASGVRGLNPSLNNLSLTKLVGFKTAEVNDLVDKGIIKSSEVDSVAETCANFIQSAITAMKSVEGCSDVTEILLNPREEAKYDSIIDQTKHSKIDNIIGLGRICLLI